jgi:hypothetical protein
MHFTTITNVLALGLAASTSLVVAEDTFAAKSGLVKRYIVSSQLAVQFEFY